MRTKKFKIIAKMNDLLSVQDTDKKERANEMVKKFINATDGGDVRVSIEVYELVEQGMYKCIHSTSYEPKNETERNIGFGRW